MVAAPNCVRVAVDSDVLGPFVAGWRPKNDGPPSVNTSRVVSVLTSPLMKAVLFLLQGLNKLHESVLAPWDAGIVDSGWLPCLRSINDC